MQQKRKGSLREQLKKDALIPSSLRLVECNDDRITLEGEYPVNARKDGYKHINERINLRVVIDKDFPEVLPIVTDLEDRIPRSLDYHTYSDGSFCLGSELRMKSIISSDPTVGNFLYKCVDPFLYSILHKVIHDEIPYELEHGAPGLITDYEKLFNVEGKDAVIRTVRLLGMKKRIANRQECPCGCGLRVGRCKLHHKLNELRKLGSRKSFLFHLHTFLQSQT